MYGKIKSHLANELKAIEEAGLFKNERIITSPQDAAIRLAGGEEVLNFCANNYLGLSSNPALIKAAKEALDTHGYGMSSVRFICEPRTCIKNSKRKLPGFLVQKIQSFMLLVSMPTGVFLNRCLAKRML